MLSTSRYKNNNALSDWLWVEADMCAGFKAGSGNGHRLVNETLEVVVCLEVGDRSPEDKAYYPDDDIKAVMMDGKWCFQHKDGRPY